MFASIAVDLPNNPPTDAPDVLAHISVRARNLKVLFATCFDADEFESLARFVGKKVHCVKSLVQMCDMPR